MYAVIFTAVIDQVDSDYAATAERMRELAFNEFGCLKFNACLEDELEIAISYWEREEQILAWKQHAEHLTAQQSGRERWYKRYDVEVMQMVRHYHFERD
ncbi:MAG: antibiotic biosynthesis monooxygenase family protein [Cellvibrionaceae bacterium]